MAKISKFQKGDLEWFKGKLLYCVGKIENTDKYLFVSPMGDKYELTTTDIILHNEISFRKPNRWLTLH